MKATRREPRIEKRLERLWQGQGGMARLLLRAACGLNQVCNAVVLPWMRGGAHGLTRAQHAAELLRRMQAAGQGFDADGMLVAQAAFAAEEDGQEVPFGRGTTALHGCGWLHSTPTKFRLTFAQTNIGFASRWQVSAGSVFRMLENGDLHRFASCKGYLE